MTDHVRTRHDQRHSYQLRLGRDISIEMTPHADASVSAPLGSDYNPANTGISAFIGARLRLDLGNGSPLSFFTDGTVGATGRFGDRKSVV